MLRTFSRRRLKPTMNILKALATVIGTAIVFGAAGASIGVFLGKAAPGFYRQTIAIRDQANFNAVELGLGFGLINGLIWGMVIGMLVVAVLAWKESRRPRPENPAKPK
jgi:hypothetical protein